MEFRLDKRSSIAWKAVGLLLFLVTSRMIVPHRVLSSESIQAEFVPYDRSVPWSLSRTLRRQNCYCYYYGVVSHKADMHCDHSWSVVRPRMSSIPSTRALWQLPTSRPSSEAGETWREVTINFAG
jgi:hypothetical protein